MAMIHKIHLAWERMRLILFTLILISMGCAWNGVAQEPVNTPAEKPVAVKVFEIGKVSGREFARRWKREDWNFFDRINRLYIINYGSNKEIAFREKVITDSIAFRNFDRPRITLVRGGLDDGAPRTVVWRVPEGADEPKP